MDRDIHAVLDDGSLNKERLLCNNNMKANNDLRIAELIDWSMYGKDICAIDGLWYECVVQWRNLVIKALRDRRII